MRPEHLSYRTKLLLFFLSALAVLYAMNVGYSALNTFSRLDVVEAQRDTWQRPSDVIAALGLKQGERVVDLGCGSGYFTLKLSPRMGRDGTVIAEDIRWLPLAFLWARKFSRGDRNVQTVHGDVSDPELPVGRVDAALIVNTFHELADPQAILAHVWKALVPGGRLVIADREPNPANIGITETGGHEIAAEQVARELAAAHFRIVSTSEPFIRSDPQNETWWLIVAVKS